jgi:hypothetical protein
MKKTILTIAISAMTLGAFAQTTLGIGARYGVGINSVSGAGTEATESSISPLNAAIIAEIGLHKNFAIQPELAYATKGFKLLTETANASYLGLNVLPKAKFGNDKIEGFVMAGIGFGMNMSAKIGDQDIKEDIKSTDMTGIFGAGAAYKLTSGKIFLDARYNLGLTNTSKVSGGELKMNQIGINIGYIHNIGK